MKINYSLLLIFFIPSITSYSQVKVGDNPATIGTSSLLELESTDKALVIPRVANSAAIATPVNGMMIYDNSSNCIVTYQNGAWSGCPLGTGSITALTCGSAVFSPTESIKDVAYNGTLTVSYAGATAGFLAGETVSSTGVTDFIATRGVTITAAGAGSVTYAISGTPTTSGTATFDIDVDGETCSIDLDVCSDLIACELSTNLAAYDAASDGDWVAVSKTEYDNLASNLSSVTPFGTAEANMLTGSIGWNTSTYTYGQSNNPSPANSYVFAFKAGQITPIIGSNDYVKLSSSNTGTGFSNIGGALPNGTADSGQQHFVLKGANTLHGSAMYLGHAGDFNHHVTNGMRYNVTGSTGRYKSGDSFDVSSGTSGSAWSLQGLSTTVLQW